MDDHDREEREAILADNDPSVEGSGGMSEYSQHAARHDVGEGDDAAYGAPDGPPRRSTLNPDDPIEMARKVLEEATEGRAD